MWESSESLDASEIILICWFGADENGLTLFVETVFSRFFD